MLGGLFRCSLGKFGLGLKTASSSVCLKFTLISRTEANNDLQKLSWDLDHVKDQDRWEMLEEEVSSHERDRFQEYCGEKGTLLIWSKCDRLLKKIYSEPGGQQERSAVTRLSTKLKEHIALVYYRFLNKDDNRAQNINIYVNGEEVSPWDPFYPERSEQVLERGQQTIECILQTGEEESAFIHAWILPHREECNEEEKKKAKHANNRQGFYVFRENRLIHYGDWLGVHGWGSIEPHMSLLRVEFDFTHLLDEAFMVDVKKSRILLDPELEGYVKKLLSPIRREADKRYRRTHQKNAAKTNIDHSGSNKSVESTRNTKKPGIVSIDEQNSSAIVSNQHGPSIKLKVPIENQVDPKSLYVEASEKMMGSDLWEPVLRSPEDIGHKTGVRINKNHDFYQKIYLRARNSGYSVQGMDLLLWAISAAEMNYSNEDMQVVFEDLREEVSSNLRKLLRDIDIPDLGDIEENE